MSAIRDMYLGELTRIAFTGEVSKAGGMLGLVDFGNLLNLAKSMVIRAAKGDIEHARGLVQEIRDYARHIPALDSDLTRIDQLLVKLGVPQYAHYGTNDPSDPDASCEAAGLSEIATGPLVQQLPSGYQWCPQCVIACGGRLKG